MKNNFLAVLIALMIIVTGCGKVDTSELELLNDTIDELEDDNEELESQIKKQLETIRDLETKYGESVDTIAISDKTISDLTAQHNSDNEKIILLEDQVNSSGTGMNFGLSDLIIDRKNLNDYYDEGFTDYIKSLNDAEGIKFQEYIPFASRIDPYFVEVGDVYGNYTVKEWETFMENDFLWEYEAVFEGEALIHCELFYELGYEDTVSIRVNKNDIYKLPNRYGTGYYIINNGGQLLENLGENFIDGMEITLLIGDISENYMHRGDFNSYTEVKEFYE